MTSEHDGRELAAPPEEHRFNEPALKNYLVAAIPGFKGDIKIRQFLGGQSNPTFLIETETSTYVLRKKPPGELLPSAHAVDREFTVTSALMETSVPVARTHVLCDDESIIGQMFYVMDYVPGRVIGDPSLPGCSADERGAMYHALIDVLGSLHSVDHEAVGLADFGRPSAYVARQVARWSKQYQASKLDDFEPMEQLIKHLPLRNPNDERAAIVHGDYRPGNVIFDRDGPHINAVLDWELSTIGHPLADLGYFLMPHRLETNAVTTGLLSADLDELGIPDELALLEAYAKSAGLDDVPDIDFYIAFSMFRLAAILAGVLRRGVDGNAADPRAVALGKTFKEIANCGWDILRE